jgi:hypothetical protein
MATPTSKHITDIRADAHLALALRSFLSACIEHEADLGLSPAEISEMTETVESFSEGLAEWRAINAKAEGALREKNLRREAAKAMVGRFAKVFRAKQSIPDSLLANLMLPPHTPPRTRSEPATPTDLVAKANGQGLITLQWKLLGKTKATTILIEFRTSPEEPWRLLDATTRNRYVVQATPGSYIAFRVRSKLSGQTSPASVPVALWSGRMDSGIGLRAA